MLLTRPSAMPMGGRADEKQRSTDFARKERGSAPAPTQTPEAGCASEGRCRRSAAARSGTPARYADLAFDRRAGRDDDVAVLAGLAGSARVPRGGLGTLGLTIAAVKRRC